MYTRITLEVKYYDGTLDTTSKETNAWDLNINDIIIIFVGVLKAHGFSEQAINECLGDDTND